MADFDYDKLSEAIKRGSGGAGGNTVSAGYADLFKKLGTDVNPLSLALKGAGEAAGKVKDAYDKVSPVVQENLDTWRKLSTTGAAFSNDVVGMSVAAASTRMSLSEFADTVGKNAAQLSGLGGNVTRGAEAFSRLSKEMFDSGATDQLKQMGYTTKEINDVLALQVGFQGATLANSKAAQQQAQQSAIELATEMDELAKLTGKSRKEQEDSMKKAAADMQAEAKLRLMTMGKSEEEAAQIRAEYLKNYNEAEARGQGQMFKEVFATGTVQSKEASMQVALQGKSAAATVAQASAISKGNLDAARRHNEDATREMGRLNNNTAYLSVAMMGTGEASKSVQKSMLDTRTAYNNEKAIRDELLKDEKNRNLSKDDLEKKVQATLKERAGQAQAGKNEKGEDVSGATRAVVQLGNRVGDVNSALMNGLVTPLNKTVGPAIGEFADKRLKAQTNVVDPKTGKAERRSFAKDIELEAEAGFKAGFEGKKPSDTLPPDSSNRQGWRANMGAQGGKSTLGGAANSIGEALGSITAKTLNITGEVTGLKAHAEGGYIGKPEIALIGEAGPEFVLNQPQMKSLIEGVGDIGKQSGAGLMQMGKDVTDSGKSSSVSLSQISKDISTTFSAVAGGGAGGGGMDKAQAKIDEAIRLKEQAQEKLNKLWNEASDDELNEKHEQLAEELKAAKENLTKVIDESMSDLVGSFDDFGDVFEDSPIADAVESASPKANPLAGLDTSGIVLGPNGMPMPGSIKAKAATLAAEPAKNETAAAAATAAEEEKKKKEAAQKKEEKPAGSTKDATLSDVVNKLDSLNKTMNRLLSTSEDLGNKQVKATKQVAAAGNTFAR
jgi:hypothetical protein